MFIVGIDPGLTGAIALNHNGERVDTWRIPTAKVAHSARRKNRVSTHVDGVALRALASDLALLQPVVWIEQVGGRPRDGAHRAFTFGLTCGRIAECFEAAGMQVRYVVPAVWRAKLGVRAYAAKNALDTKESSRRVASELWPACADQWKLKGHDGRAEAALLSEYGRRFG